MKCADCPHDSNDHGLRIYRDYMIMACVKCDCKTWKNEWMDDKRRRRIRNEKMFRM